MEARNSKSAPARVRLSTMAPVIWGLDLKEMQWGKFKSSYMWNSEYHLRRTKFIVYQCALIFCVVSESLGTAALSGKYHSNLHTRRGEVETNIRLLLRLRRFPKIRQTPRSPSLRLQQRLHRSGIIQHLRRRFHRLHLRRRILL